jgi:hypothetical protein
LKEYLETVDLKVIDLKAMNLKEVDRKAPAMEAETVSIG